MNDLHIYMYICIYLYKYVLYQYTYVMEAPRSDCSHVPVSGVTNGQSMKHNNY